MYRSVIAGMIALIVSTGSAFANDQDPGQPGQPGYSEPGQPGQPGQPGHGKDKCPDGKDCTPPTKEVCFNLVCYFDAKKDDHKGFRSCTVASIFDKAVTKDGGEVRDDSTKYNNPTFAVKCDGEDIYNNSARRFTDLLGTRIQGQTGPFPALSLPRGALHTEPNGGAGAHVSYAAFEVDNGWDVQRFKGKCHIWTGAP